jgi:hypothetical protein
MAACMIAKLRVECTVAGWAPGVRTTVNSTLFHWITGSTAGAAAAAALASVAWAARLAQTNPTTLNVPCMTDHLDRPRNSVVLVS